MKRTRLLLLLTMVTLLLLPGTLIAAAGDQPAKLAVTASQLPDGQVELQVRLTDAAGKAISNQPVEFWIGTDFFAERSLFVAERVTDTAGKTKASYTPTWSGAHTFKVRYAGSSTHQATESSLVLEAKAAAAAYSAHSPGLVSVRQGTSAGAVAVLLAVWATLLAVVVRIGIGLARPAQKPATAKLALEQARGSD